jgi:hypothetical protein
MEYLLADLGVGSNITGGTKPPIQLTSGCKIAETGLDGGGPDGSPIVSDANDAILKAFACLCAESMFGCLWRACQLGHLLGPPFSTKGSSS